MTLGPQFEQPELPGMPQERVKPETSMQYKLRQVRSGVGASGGYHGKALQRFESLPAESRTPTDSFHRPGDQLKMFMTPREIEREWQPLDADRDEVYGETFGTNDSRAGESTKRAFRTDDVPNVYMGRTPKTEQPTGWSRVVHRPKYQRPDIDYPSSYGGDMETDEQLWDRKYEEATGFSPKGQHALYGGNADATKYKDNHGRVTTSSAHWTTKTGSTSGHRSETLVTHERLPGQVDDGAHNSMVDSIIHEGIKSPIRLGLNYGQNDMPQLAGGHHRMSVARVHSPDQFAPVLYHKDIHEARSRNTQHSYKYT